MPFYQNFPNFTILNLGTKLDIPKFLNIKVSRVAKETKAISNVNIFFIQSFIFTGF